MQHTAPQLVVDFLLEDESFLERMLDRIQAALDAAGLSMKALGTGTNAANVAISLLRAASTKNSDKRKKYLIDAGIVALTHLPVADLVRLLKNRKMRSAAAGIARFAQAGMRAFPKSYQK